MVGGLSCLVGTSVSPLLTGPAGGWPESSNLGTARRSDGRMVTGSQKKKIVVDCTEKRKLAIGWEAISHA
jgi:hypothetical protein